MTPKHAKPEPPEPEGEPSGPVPEAGGSSPAERAGHAGASEPAPAQATGAVEPAEPGPTEPAGPAERAEPAEAGVPAPAELTEPTPRGESAEPASPEPAGPARAPDPAPDGTPAGSGPAQPPTSAPTRSRTGGWRLPRAQSRWMWGVLALLGVVLVGSLVVQVVGSIGDPDPEPTGAPTAPAEQQSLLIQVRNDSEFGSNNMVAGVGGSLPVAQVLVPSRLIVDVPGAGQQTLGRSARLLDRSASQDALSDLLALRIDGTLSLGRLALAGMVDFVGGITIVVDEPVTVEDPATGASSVLVPAGQQLLDGTQAAAYALAWLPDEPEAARLARFSTVMTETIGSLPDDQLRVEQMLTSLGGSARTTTSTSAVAGFLVQMRAGILAGGQQVRVLPTTSIDAGSGLEVVRVDLEAADAMLGTLLPDAQLNDESSPRVLVQNGVGTPGLGASARDKLVAAGMVYINGGNAEEFGRPTTLIIVEDDSASAQQLGEEVAEALGVPDTAVAIADEGQNVADVVVILGVDFEP
jgi:hypothetical protein